LYRNHATFEGGGFFGADGLADTLRLLYNDISENTTGSYASGGGVWIGGSNAEIKGNVIRGNSGSNSGGGIWAGFAGAKRIVDNKIRGNRSDGMGGAIWIDQGKTLVEKNTLDGNVTRLGPELGVGSLREHVVRDNSVLPAPGGDADVGARPRVVPPAGSASATR
jgi:hypothetical protein